ncbi:MAG: UDP-4-amino-4,6-dideoxy-N-acetyl-beta-L-altrosamine transaminase [Methanothrix sp.]
MARARSEEELAVNGGKPVRPTLLPYGHQIIDNDDIQAVVRVLQSDWITTGPKVAEFEETFAVYVGARHAVSFSSGTAALHAAAYAAGLKPGDEAITTPMTFCATSNSILYQRATPVFADVSSDTLNINPDEIEKRITDKTKAIIPVDFAGHPADLLAINEIASDNGLTVIEDACHALGAKYNEKKVGSISDLTVFSFHPVKHITTGEGGMVVTESLEMANRMRSFRNHGILSDFRQRALQGSWYYEMVDLGYNYRLTDIQCSLGLSQLGKLDKWLSRRRAIAAIYDSYFKDSAFVKPLGVRSDVSHAYHLYVVRINLDRLGKGRDAIFAALRAEGIGVNVHYIPVHLHPFYRMNLGTGPGMCPVAETAYGQILSLPMFSGMSDSDAHDVIDAVQKVTEVYGL